MVGRRLRSMRGNRSLRAVAESAGISVGTLIAIEHGKSEPRLGTLVALIEACDHWSVDEAIAPLRASRVVPAGRRDKSEGLVASGWLPNWEALVTDLSERMAARSGAGLLQLMEPSFFVDEVLRSVHLVSGGSPVMWGEGGSASGVIEVLAAPALSLVPVYAARIREHGDAGDLRTRLERATSLAAQARSSGLTVAVVAMDRSACDVADAV